MLKIGGQNISAVFLGGGKIKKAYLGEDVVFDIPAPPVPTYSISTAIEGGSGAIEGTGYYQEGDTVILTATPGDGYKFTDWKENGVVVSTDAVYTFTATRDRLLTTKFEEEKVSRLPEGYVELEYLKSNINTNYYLSGCAINTAISGGVVKLKIYIESFPTASTNSDYAYWKDSFFYWIDTLSDTSSSYTMVGLFISKSGISMYGKKNATSLSASTVVTVTVPNTNKAGVYEITYDAVHHTVSINGSTPVSPSTATPPASGNSSTNSFIGALGFETSKLSGNSYYGAYRVLECTVSNASNSSGAYNAHLIPARHVSDGTVGFYDLVNQVFRSSRMSAKQPFFTAGPAV